MVVVMSANSRTWELPRGTLGVGFPAPVIAAMATWGWSYAASLLYPGWLARACVDHIPAPLLGRTRIRFHSGMHDRGCIATVADAPTIRPRVLGGALRPLLGELVPDYSRRRCDDQ